MMDEKRSKKRRHLCLAKLGVARGARGADPVDEGFWRLNKHVITDCLQLATLYLPTKVTVHPLPAVRWIRHPLPDLLVQQTVARRREKEREPPSQRTVAHRLGYVARHHHEMRRRQGLRTNVGTPSTW
ncbi:hypothetical protein K0M31_018677 [Melipona bicolor]|uniref:Uncharacterized protein n=1 Tax=Melipona bicolor TaxID=60889 RepID=A0AA40G3S9_9HYME|nr:hypothetical protein K0M31_018677 [Melipona bicolor]